MAVKITKSDKPLKEAFSMELFDECAAEMARHESEPRAMLRVALKYASPHTATMNRGILIALATAWIGFRLERGPECSGKLRELDQQFMKHPRADEFLKCVKGFMTGNGPEDRKIAGDVALLLMAKRVHPERKLSDALRQLLPKSRKGTNRHSVRPAHQNHLS